MAGSAGQQAAIAIHRKATATKKSPAKASAKTSAKTTAEKSSEKKSSEKKSSAKKASTKKSSARKATKEQAGKPLAKHAAGGQSAAKKASAGKRAGSVAKTGKDPRGGLTAQGRKQLNEETGGHLRPGVKGAADTPEKKQRKGSFLRRHFANPPGPVMKDGKPTRQALQAAAWGEPVPKTVADEKKLAAKGSKLLEQARSAKGTNKAAR